jgi:hypothetical protein
MLIKVMIDGPDAGLIKTMSPEIEYKVVIIGFWQAPTVLHPNGHYKFEAYERFEEDKQET